MSALTHVVATILVLAAALAAGPAAGQLSRPPRDPAQIQRKMQRSAEFQRQALEGLGDPAKAERLVRNAYDQLKSAYDDMVINASNMQFPDPLLAANSKRVGQALVLLQGAWDALKLHAQWSDAGGQVEGVRHNLQQSLRLTNTVLATSF